MISDEEMLTVPKNERSDIVLKNFVNVVKTFYSIDKISVILFFICSFAQVPLLMGELLYTKYFIDTIKNSTMHFNGGNILTNMVILMVIIYINNILGCLNALCETNIEEISLLKKDEFIIEKTLKLSMIDLDSPNTKSHREKAMELKLNDFLIHGGNFLTDSLKIAMLIVVLVYFKLYILVPIIIGFMILQLLANKYAATKVERTYGKQVSSIRFIKYLFSLLVDRENIQEISILKIHKYLKAKLNNISNKNTLDMGKEVFHEEFMKLILKLFYIVVNMIVTIILVLTVATSTKSGGQFVLLYQIVNKLFSLGSSLSSHYHDLTQCNIKYNDFSSYMQKEEEEICTGYSTISKNGLEIKLNNLAFSYPDSEAKALSEINLNIKAGEKVAFVGENGSGKSTLIKIIMGLYKPAAGIIKWHLEGEDVPYNSVGNKVRVVFQDYAKLLRPIRENVALGDIRKLNSEAELCSALEKADMYQYSQNLDTLVGPEFGGLDMSGGQWQRLAIARAYLNQGALLIYDEATSALDPVSELKAFNSFLDLADNKTAIFVTHRLSMTKFVDKIAVIEEGQIKEYGTQEELLKKNGKYADMYYAQSSLYIN